MPRRLYSLRGNNHLSGLELYRQGTPNPRVQKEL
ncbi:hypothetical protein VPHK45_0002 [Vibrio phage K45]